MRLTVAFVRPGDETAAIVQKLLARSRVQQMQIDVLYLDRGFCTTPVMA